MKIRNIPLIASLLITAGVFVFIGFFQHEERLPDIYYSLDKTKPWDEVARTLDSRMSVGQYNKMRTQYFYDVVEPKIENKSLTYGTYEEFMRRTDRPWQWDRRVSSGDPSRSVVVLFWLACTYLAIWVWSSFLKPIGLIVRDEGVIGVANLVLHGKSSKVRSLHNSK